MDKNNKSLAEQILDGDMENLEERVRLAPYSQPLQRMASLAGLPHRADILSYHRNSPNEIEDIDSKSGVTLGTISIDFPTKEKSKKAKAKKSPTIAQPTPKTNPPKPQRMSKKTKGKSEFASWLLGCEQLEGGAEVKKADKKRKKRKKKAKTVLDKNIKNSVEEKEEIASEALAKLYAAQGHHKKALKMYEKLSLINPQKSSFFAPLIENLKNKLR